MRSKRGVFCIGFCVLMLFSYIGNAQQQPLEFPIIFQLDAEMTITDLDWNFDSTLLAFVDGYDEVTVINVDAGEVDLRLERVKDEMYVITAISWSSTHNHLLIGNNLTKIWDYSESKWLNDFEFPSAVEFVEYTSGAIDWHPIKDSFAIVLRECEEGTPYRPGARVEIWDVETSTFTPIAGCIFGKVKWNPQGTQLAINGVSVFDDEGFEDFEEIEIWNVDTEEKLLTITDLQDPWGVAWSPSGDMIAFTTRILIDRYIQVWDVFSDELVWQVEANLGVFAPLDWHPSDNFIVTGGQDGSVRLWDARSGLELLELPVHGDTVNDVSWSPDGKMLASVGRDGRLFIWDVSVLSEEASTP